MFQRQKDFLSFSPPFAPPQPYTLPCHIHDMITFKNVVYVGFVLLLGHSLLLLLNNRAAKPMTTSLTSCTTDLKNNQRTGITNLERLQRLRCRPQPSHHQNYTVPIYEFDPTLSIPRLFTKMLPNQQEPDYTYSRFNDAFPLDSSNAIHFAVLCDRKNSTLPLRALINSILKFSSKPVVIHMVKSYHSMEWLDKLDSPYFQINFYHYERIGLLGDVIRLQKKYDYKSLHRSDPYPQTKIFFSILPFPRKSIKNVIIIDDDFTFQDDPAKLYGLLDPTKLAMACPEDPERVQKWYSDRPNDGHPSKYCNSGLINMPILERSPHDEFGWTNDILDMYMVAMRNMHLQYPGVAHRLSDQDVFNRVFAENEANMENIPCEWHCYYTSCRERTGNEAGTCQNCPTIGRANEKGELSRCRAFHFLAHAYEEHMRFPDPENEFDYVFNLNSLQLLYHVFLPRFLDAATPPCAP